MVKDIMDDPIKIIDHMLNKFDKYEGSLESGLEIIESNQLSIDKLKNITSNGHMIWAEEDEIKLKLVLNKQRELIAILGKEKEELFKMIKQINKKNSVVNSYMSTNIKSIFVDKDI